MTSTTATIICEKPAASGGASDFPNSVSSSCDPTRWKSLQPRTFSRRRKRWLIAEGVRLSSRAAFLIDMCRAATSKARSAFNGTAKVNFWPIHVGEPRRETHMLRNAYFTLGLRRADHAKQFNSS